MASIELGGGPAGKKAVDANVPLIPFIDLLLCCVMFLLVTAVWNQLASHDAVQNVPGAHSADEPEPERLRFVVQVTGAGYLVSSTAGDRFVIPKLGSGGYDETKLGEQLARCRERAPDERAITLWADDGVVYDDVVQAMDVAAAHGFTGFALSDS